MIEIYKYMLNYVVFSYGSMNIEKQIRKKIKRKRFRIEKHQYLSREVETKQTHIRKEVGGVVSIYKRFI